LHGIHFYIVLYHSLSLQADKAIVGLSYTRSTGWILKDRQGHEYKAILQDESLCTRYVVILQFKLILSQQPRSVIILPDSLSNTAFRTLQKLLRWVV